MTNLDLSWLGTFFFTGCYNLKKKNCVKVSFIKKKEKNLVCMEKKVVFHRIMTNDLQGIAALFWEIADAVSVYHS